MEDAAQLQPLLHTLVLFSYVVHSNKTDGAGGAPLRLYQKWVFIQTEVHTRKFLDSLQFCI